MDSLIWIHMAIFLKARTVPQVIAIIAIIAGCFFPQSVIS